MAATGDDGAAAGVLVRVTVVEQDLQKCLMFDLKATVWTAKQIVLKRLAKGLPDAINYGMYLPPENGRAGKFLVEERLLGDYPLHGPVAHLEFKYKRRVYKNLPPAALKNRGRLHTRTALKRFIELIVKKQTAKVKELLERGTDPNFHDEDSGETPMTLAALQDNAELVGVLVEGGAHMEFRARDGLTPLHKAAIRGMHRSLQTMLDFGASPDVRDADSLTPLYHTCVHGGSTRCALILLKDQAQHGVMDEHGWAELHQACRRGHESHLEVLIVYGANMDVRNQTGNTPLHVCGTWDQLDCAQALLRRGADKDAVNRAGQTPYEVAMLAGATEVANLLRIFDTSSVQRGAFPPAYTERQRLSSISTRKTSARGGREIEAKEGIIKIDASGADEFVLPKTFVLERQVLVDKRTGEPAYSTPLTSLTRRTLAIPKGTDGYGFRLIGSKHTAVSQSSDGQIVRTVDEGGAAQVAGLLPGDRILAVNGHDVTYASHHRVVDLVKSARSEVVLVVGTPAVESRTECLDAAPLRVAPAGLASPVMSPQLAPRAVAEPSVNTAAASIAAAAAKAAAFVNKKSTPPDAPPRNPNITTTTTTMVIPQRQPALLKNSAPPAPPLLPGAIAGGRPRSKSFGAPQELPTRPRSKSAGPGGLLSVLSDLGSVSLKKTDGPREANLFAGRLVDDGPGIAAVTNTNSLSRTNTAEDGTVAAVGVHPLAGILDVKLKRTRSSRLPGELNHQGAAPSAMRSELKVELKKTGQRTPAGDFVKTTDSDGHGCDDGNSTGVGYDAADTQANLTPVKLKPVSKPTADKPTASHAKPPPPAVAPRKTPTPVRKPLPVLSPATKAATKASLASPRFVPNPNKVSPSDTEAARKEALRAALCIVERTRGTLLTASAVESYTHGPQESVYDDPQDAIVSIAASTDAATPPKDEIYDEPQLLAATKLSVVIPSAAAAAPTVTPVEEPFGFPALLPPPLPPKLYDATTVTSLPKFPESVDAPGPGDILYIPTVAPPPPQSPTYFEAMSASPEVFIPPPPHFSPNTSFEEESSSLQLFPPPPLSSFGNLPPPVFAQEGEEVVRISEWSDGQDSPTQRDDELNVSESETESDTASEKNEDEEQDSVGWSLPPRMVVQAPADFATVKNPERTITVPSKNVHPSQQLAEGHESLQPTVVSPTVQPMPAPQHKATLPLPVPARYAIATFAFTARNEDELTFAPGAKVLLLKTPEGGWWKARLGDADGWFPCNHVRETIDMPKTGANKLSYCETGLSSKNSSPMSHRPAPLPPTCGDTASTPARPPPPRSNRSMSVGKDLSTRQAVTSPPVIPQPNGSVRARTCTSGSLENNGKVRRGTQLGSLEKPGRPPPPAVLSRSSQEADMGYEPPAMLPPPMLPASKVPSSKLPAASPIMPLSFNSNPSHWSVADVLTWLEQMGLAEYQQVFQENAIQGQHLLELSKDDLKELNITRLGHRMTIAKAIEELRLQASSS